MRTCTRPAPPRARGQVYNLTTYPHFVGFLDALGVDTEPSDMSFALSLDGGRLEWGSHGLDTIFAQRANLASPSFLRVRVHMRTFACAHARARAGSAAARGAAPLQRGGNAGCSVHARTHAHTRRPPARARAQMVWDVVRFGREAPRVLEPAHHRAFADMSLGAYLSAHGYSAGFVDNYVVPMCAAVWSVPKAQVRARAPAPAHSSNFDAHICQ